jgi:hypothetical protein
MFVVERWKMEPNLPLVPAELPAPFEPAASLLDTSASTHQPIQRFASADHAPTKLNAEEKASELSNIALEEISMAATSEASLKTSATNSSRHRQPKVWLPTQKKLWKKRNKNLQQMHVPPSELNVSHDVDSHGKMGEVKCQTEKLASVRHLLSQPQEHSYIPWKIIWPATIECKYALSYIFGACIACRVI